MGPCTRLHIPVVARSWAGTTGPGFGGAKNWDSYLEPGSPDASSLLHLSRESLVSSRTNAYLPIYSRVSCGYRQEMLRGRTYDCPASRHSRTPFRVAR